MQVSWIDPGELAGLLDSLASPTPATPQSLKQEVAVPESEATAPADWDGWLADFSEAPEHSLEDGFTVAQNEDEIPTPEPEREQIAAIRKRLGEIRTQAITAGLMRKTESEEVIAMPVPESRPPVWGLAPPSGLDLAPEDGLGERLAAFRAWAGQQLDSDAQILILDENGDLLCGPPMAASLILSALMAMNSARRNSADHFSGHASMMTRACGQKKYLSLIPCTTPLGCIQIAVVQSAPLHADTAAHWEKALAAVIAAN